MLFRRAANIMLFGRTHSRSLVICLPWSLGNWRAEMTHLLPAQEGRCPLGSGHLQRTYLRLHMLCILWKQLWSGMKMSVISWFSLLFNQISYLDYKYMVSVSEEFFCLVACFANRFLDLNMTWISSILLLSQILTCNFCLPFLLWISTM